MSRPAIFVLAGPNGAGKSTCAAQLLPQWLHVEQFVNADLIAKGLSPFARRMILQAVGHDVSREVVERRFGRGLSNFIPLYGPPVDTWILCDPGLYERIKRQAGNEGN